LTNQAVAVSAPSAIDFTEQFFTDNAFPEGVRRDRAAEGLRNPDALAAFEFDDLRVLLATRSITSDRSSYITLVVASQIGNGVVAISGAFKVFGSQSELDDIRKDPLKAFTTLIDRYGLEIQLCGFQGEFFPAVTAEIPEGESVPIIGVPQEQSLSMCVLGQRVDSGPSHIVRFVWSTPLRRTITAGPLGRVARSSFDVFKRQRVQPRAARGPAGGRTPRASACGCIGHSAARRRRRRLEQVWKI